MPQYPNMPPAEACWSMLSPRMPARKVSSPVRWQAGLNDVEWLIFKSCCCHLVFIWYPSGGIALHIQYIYIYLRRGDESQPLARIFLFPHRNVVVPAMIEVITPNVLFQSRLNRSPNHLQHLWKTSPCFATLHPPFLSITSHPLANYLVPNRNGRCSPLSFGVPPFSSVFPLLLMIFLHILSFFQTFFLPFLHFPPFSSSVTSRNLP